MSTSRIILRAYDTSCQMKNAEKSMKNRSVNPENLNEMRREYTEQTSAYNLGAMPVKRSCDPSLMDPCYELHVPRHASLHYDLIQPCDLVWPDTRIVDTSKQES